MRTCSDNLKTLGISVVLAAVACAGCVGWSYLQEVLDERPASSTPAVRR
ncbi:hypothetical protein LZG04_19035 [Saccharothrix sp. S26]|nr:hypothetical protein [Saccharothrix sp. S26]MCE6996882.1 hypothetical protein [Saccharothrix sp. S26]